MSTLRRLFHRLLSSARGRDDERLREEVESHIGMQTAENLRAGMPPDEARRRAVLSFGPVEAIKDSYRAEQRVPAIDDLIQDVRYACRQLRRSPLFALAAVVSLAIGVGANTAVFAVVERVLLRSLPVPNPHELVLVTDERILTQANPRFSYPFYAIVRDNDVLGGVAAHFSLGVNASVDGQTVRANGDLVSGNYFEVLGTTAEAGRLLTPADDRTPGAHPVAVISEPFWRRTFAADPAIAGRTIGVNDTTFTIVGVAAKEFTGTSIAEPPDIWIPLAMQREAGRNLMTDARTNWLELIGRLRRGQSQAHAADALTSFLQQRSGELPPPASATRLVLLPGGKGSLARRAELQSTLMALFVLTGLALALACVNVAGLSAVRSAGREKEIAIRLALGARRSRLRRQLLTEGVVLAVIAGSVGALAAPAAARALATAQSSTLRIDTGLNLTVIAFVAATSLLAGVIVAMLPILASRDVALKPSAGPGAMHGSSRARRLLAHDAIVALQIAMALSMLISAAVLVQSLRRFHSVDPGFRADNLVLATLDARAGGYDANRIDGFWRAVLDRARQIPGVEHVSLAGTVPLAAGRQRQPWRNPSSGEKVELGTNFVGPAYFETLAIPILRGRDFTDDDGRASRLVVVVNERFAERFWPGQDPIGKGVDAPESGNPVAEVVGVVRDVNYQDLRGEAAPMIYRPVLQTRTTDAMTLHVRAAGDPAALTTAIRQAVQAVDRTVPLFRITTLEEQLDASFAQTRHAALLTGTCGLLALILSGVGVYGVTALAVSRRTRDIGIRMALGAGRADIVRAIGAHSVVLIVIGLALGLAGAFGVTRVTGTLVFGVTATDAATFAAMSMLLAVVSLAAFAIPVRAATRLDALAAIRHE